MNLLENKILAKSELAWLQKPDDVCKGAQEYRRIYKLLIADMPEIIFKNAGDITILYKYIEHLISSAEWGIKGYQSVTAPYTMSAFSYLVSRTGKLFDFNQILDSKSAPKELEDILNVISRVTHGYITTPKEGYEYRSMWHKQSDCWDEVKALIDHIEISNSLLE